MVKFFTFGIILLMSFTTNATSAEDIDAIEIVKAVAQVQNLIDRHPPDKYDIRFQQMPVGGQCGIVGCTWRKLVAIVVEAKRANRPTLTLLAEVSNNIPDRGAKPQVRFVDLTDMDPAVLNSQL